MNVLTIQGLSKAFGGQKIIDNLNMAVPEGSVFGFIGQNGAGKTTTMKMVLGLLRPDQGEINVCGEPVHFGQTKTNQYIGYLPDVPEFYDYMTSTRYLALCGKIIGLSKTETQQRSEELLSLVGLGNIKKTIGGFSRGMKQRLGIAQALLTRPKLLICDEPTSALDPWVEKKSWIFSAKSAAPQRSCFPPTFCPMWSVSATMRSCWAMGRSLSGGRFQK